MDMSYLPCEYLALDGCQNESSEILLLGIRPGREGDASPGAVWGGLLGGAGWTPKTCYRKRVSLPGVPD